MSDGPSVERRAVWGRSHWGPAAVVYWLYQGHQSVPTEGVATAPKENACVLQTNSFCPKWLCATICPLTGLKAGPIHRLATLPCPRSENDLAIQMAWFRNLACVDRAFRWEQNHRKETSGECSAAGCLGLSSIPHGLLVWPLGAPAQTSMSFLRSSWWSHAHHKVPWQGLCSLQPHILTLSNFKWRPSASYRNSGISIMDSKPSFWEFIPVGVKHLTLLYTFSQIHLQSSALKIELFVLANMNINFSRTQQHGKKQYSYPIRKFMEQKWTWNWWWCPYNWKLG